jgi:TRAP-type C4-dicarboxylate transport system permease small subunit
VNRVSEPVDEKEHLEPRRRNSFRAPHHLKWPALDGLERGLMATCALLLVGVTVCEAADVAFRNFGHPWLYANEFATGFFVWGVFLGMSVAVRRGQHFRLTNVAESLQGRSRWIVETMNRLVVLGVAVCMVVFGYVNTLNGLGSFLIPSETPIAVLYMAIPVAGALVALFVLEELINGWRRGFARPQGDTGSNPGTGAPRR